MRYVPARCRFIQDPHGVRRQKTVFFNSYFISNVSKAVICCHRQQYQCLSTVSSVKAIRSAHAWSLVYILRSRVRFCTQSTEYPHGFVRVLHTVGVKAKACSITHTSVYILQRSGIRPSFSNKLWLLITSYCPPLPCSRSPRWLPSITSSHLPLISLLEIRPVFPYRVVQFSVPRPPHVVR
jgi:hypothetical protein